MCTHVGNGWTYSAVTLNEDGDFESYIAPDGTSWLFYDYDALFANYEEPEDFYFSIYAANEFEDYFDYDDTFVLFETYTSSLEYFYYYDSNGYICELLTEADEEGNIIGFNVLDSYDSCPLVADGWTHADFVLDEYNNPLYYSGPDGELWYFYSEEELFAQPEIVEEPFYFGLYGASPFDYNFDENEIYAFLETYDEGLDMFYYYDSSGAACEFNSDFDENGNL